VLMVEEGGGMDEGRTSTDRWAGDGMAEQGSCRQPGRTGHANDREMDISHSYIYCDCSTGFTSPALELCCLLLTTLHSQ
jgi:hypothetical protein